MDNYLLDARRAAIATQAGSDRERHDAKRRSNRTRIVAVAFLMLFGEPKGARATALLYASDWAFLRAPILGAIACCLCCHAGALRHCLMHRQ